MQMIGTELIVNATGADHTRCYLWENSPMLLLLPMQTAIS
jgi:hypothetical protein